jgi:hypothetical protein
MRVILGRALRAGRLLPVKFKNLRFIGMKFDNYRNQTKLVIATIDRMGKSQN